MFRWFRKRTQRPQVEARWSVVVEPAHVEVTDEVGRVRMMAKAELSGVVVETNDSGPWGADVWWLLFGVDDQLECMFPQGATGDQAAVDFFMSLPGFDLEQMTNAMCSTENAVFPVWRKLE